MFPSLTVNSIVYTSISTIHSLTLHSSRGNWLSARRPDKTPHKWLFLPSFSSGPGRTLRCCKPLTWNGCHFIITHAKYHTADVPLYHSDWKIVARPKVASTFQLMMSLNASWCVEGLHVGPLSPAADMIDQLCTGTVTCSIMWLLKVHTLWAAHTCTFWLCDTLLTTYVSKILLLEGVCAIETVGSWSPISC